HYFFLKLAEKHDLPEAKEYIDGFYATLYGKVEIETEEGRKPAPGAKVTVIAPKDKNAPKKRREWTTNADENGKYKIKYVILHKDCSPFEITAEYQGAEEETTYEGPLEEPDSSYEYEKNLLIRPLWEGTIASTFEMRSKGDESLITAIRPGSRDQAITNWKLDVVFKLDRGNERVKIYELKSVKFSFSDTVESELMKLETQEGKIRMGGNWEAQVKNRNLTRSECDLELVIDRKKKTYKIEGVLHVKNITQKFKGEIELDLFSIHDREKETDNQMIEHREEILIEGKFSEDFPWELEGSLDEIKATPPEFQEFMEGLAGQITSKIRWRLKKKGKH
ncbi:MAG: hypothetical protein KAU91_03960, partial [Candidatus Aminicenantes bacterium]|nr:hypothetical protein [Candidatus Aminicenantes bacterium]